MRSERALFVACLVAGAAGSVAARPARPARTKPPALFSRMFVQGMSWKLPYQTTSTTGKKRERHRGTMTCTVVQAEATQHPDVWRSEISCDGTWRNQTDAPLVFGASGYYAANVTGLWSDYESGIALDPKQMVLAAHPRAFRTKPDADGGTRFVERFHGGWCYGTTSRSEGGEVSYGTLLCLRKGTLVGGRSYSNATDGSATKVAIWGHAPNR